MCSISIHIVIVVCILYALPFVIRIFVACYLVCNVQIVLLLFVFQFLIPDLPPINTGAYFLHNFSPYLYFNIHYTFFSFLCFVYFILLFFGGGGGDDDVSVGGSAVVHFC
jgi:hypothetical protein